jgi:hypothetical protein
MLRRSAASLVLLAACHGAPSLPESPPLGAGVTPGLVSFDPTPPEGAHTWAAPAWHKGDHFELLWGGIQPLEFTVTEVGEKEYTLVDGRGDLLRRGRDLALLGEQDKGADRPTHVLEPADYQFHWPLWIGKNWRCQYVDRTVGKNAYLIEAAYRVEGLDSVPTRAGTFQALRIVRTARLLNVEGTFADRVWVIWYAPDIGLEVRRLLGDTCVELTKWTSAAKG